MPDKHAVDHYDDRDHDELLDRALASYVDAEPDPSMRARIMARTAEAPPRRTSRIGWLAAAACAASLLFAFLLQPAAHSPRPQPQPQTEPSAQRSIASAPESSAPVAASSRHANHPRTILGAHRRRRDERPTLAHSGSFPSPSPLTAEENILLSFAAEHPDQARQVLTTSAQDRAPLDTKPLSIAPIHIAELTPLKPLQSEE
jgi:hypothetical protein